MLELLAIVLLSVGSLPPLEPQAKQKQAEAVPADQAAASAVKPAPQARALPARAVVPVPAAVPNKSEPTPVKTELGPVAYPEIRSEADRAYATHEPAAEAPRKPGSKSDAKSEAKGESKSEKKVRRTARSEKGEAEPRHDTKAADDGKEAVKPEAEAPTEDQQHAAAPSLAPGAICDELRRAARDRREDKFKLTQEREALVKERTRLEALAAEIAQARTALKEETARLQMVIDKVNEKAKGPVKPGLPAPALRPTAAAGGGPSLADAVRK